MNIQKKVLFLCTALFILLFPMDGYGQSSGTAASATGTVRDSQGVPLGGATVTVKELKTNATRELTSEEDGSFLISQLPPGEYELRAAAPGFAERVYKTTLIIGTTALLNFALPIEGVSDIVVVQAEGTVLVEGRTERATNIQAESIANLPINRRDFLDFSLTTAGVTPDRIPASGATVSSKLSFNGQSARQNRVTIDGLDNTDSSNGAVRSTFSQDAVQEFQVVSANYSAEFGRASGGIVNIVTQSGSNEYHGSLFEYLRNDELSARDALSPFKPDFKQNQFGATFGGPIKKERAFFFTSFERLSMKQNNIVTVSDLVVASAGRVGFNISNGPIPFSEASTRFLGRGDFQISPNDRLTVRYNYGGEYNGQIQAFGGLKPDTSSGMRRLNDNTIAVSNTLISPSLNLINETRFQFSRRDQDLDPIDPFGPNVILFAPEGQIQFGRDPLLPQSSLSRNYEVINNVSLSRGRNQIKTGIDLLFARIPRLSVPVLFSGNAIFQPIDFSQLAGIPGLPSFTALELFDPALRSPAQQGFLSVLSGILPVMFPGFPGNAPLTQFSIPIAYLQGFGNPNTSGEYDYISAYAQDDIKIKPNLLVKAGIRYDRERLGSAPENSGNFSPRIAFSYTLAGEDRLNIFGSYGIFHGTTQIATATVGKILDGKTVATPVLPFPFSILGFNQIDGKRKFPEGASIPPGVPLIPQLARNVTLSPTLKNGYAQHANFGFNFLINNSTSVSAVYQYVRGLKVFLARNVNPIVRPGPNPILSAVTGRVDPTRGELISFESSGDSYYNAVTFSLVSRMSSRFSLLAHYTYSKAIDNYIDSLRVDILELQNPLNLKDERGLSLQDVRNRFVFSGIYDTGKTSNPFLRDFTVSSIVTLSSGQPFNLLTGVDLDGNGDNPPADRPNRIGRNAGLGPGFASVDMRISRSVNFGERVRLTGYAEVFNIFNRLNVSDVNRIFPPGPDGRSVLPPDDGRIKAASDRFTATFRPRQFQLGFRLSF